MRKIIHVDMDAFYAAVEQRDDPKLRGRPVAVGGGGPRGVVMAASYEARRYGVRSAMPGFQARRLCPELIFVRTRFDAYKAASGQIRTIFVSYTDLVEPLSLDEAYLDVTAPKRGPPSATEIARAIKDEIRAATGLTASAGVSFNKFLAKVASDLHKPDGLTVIRPEQAAAFIASLPIERFFGVGPKTAQRMKALGIHNGVDLAARSEDELVRRFGKVGHHYFRIVRGLDEREVRPDRPYKSIGAERTFERDLGDPEAMLEQLRPIAEQVAERMTAADSFGRTVTLKIKHHDFTVTTRQHTLADWVHSAEELIALAAWLLHHPEPPRLPVRLLGLAVSNFALAPTAPRQLSLDLRGIIKSPERGGRVAACGLPWDHEVRHRSSMMSFTVAVSDLQFVGHDLARPECVVATARGDVFVSDRRGGIMHLMPGGGQRLIAGRGVEGFLPNGFSLLPDRSFAVANIGHLGGAWRLLPDGELIPEVVAVEGMALPPTNFVHAEAHDGALRLWVSVSTRHVPREQAFRRDIADGYIVLKDGTDVRIVADGLGFTNETKVDPSGRWLYVNETMARRLSRFAIRDRSELGARRNRRRVRRRHLPRRLRVRRRGRHLDRERGQQSPAAHRGRWQQDGPPRGR